MKIIRLTIDDLSNIENICHSEKLDGFSIDKLYIPRELTKKEFKILHPHIMTGNILTTQIIIEV